MRVRDLIEKLEKCCPEAYVYGSFIFDSDVCEVGQYDIKSGRLEVYLGDDISGVDEALEDQEIEFTKVII